MAETDDQVGIFVGDVDAAGIGHPAVNDSDLPVVPVVEVDAVHIPVDRVENPHLDPRVLNVLQGIICQAGQITEVVKNQIDLHPGRSPLLQHAEDAVPDLSLCQDVILHEDGVLRLCQVGDQVLKKGSAVPEIPGCGVSVHRKPLLLQIGCQPPPGGRLAAQAGQIGLTGHFLALPLRDGRDLPQTQLLGLVGPTPQAEQNHTGHRQHHQQTHPGQLIAGTARPLVDPDSRQGSCQFQKAVYIAGLFLEEISQQQCGGDLGKNCQRTHGDAGCRGDLPLDSFRGHLVMHRAHPFFTIFY